jgi:hypothetical protein
METTNIPSLYGKIWPLNPRGWPKNSSLLPVHDDTELVELLIGWKRMMAPDFPEPTWLWLPSTNYTARIICK